MGLPGVWMRGQRQGLCDSSLLPSSWNGPPDNHSTGLDPDRLSHLTRPASLPRVSPTPKSKSSSLSCVHSSWEGKERPTALFLGDPRIVLIQNQANM
jgi:hypothetical protein